MLTLQVHFESEPEESGEEKTALDVLDAMSYSYPLVIACCWLRGILGSVVV